jgi:hypothetical protein
MKTKKALGFGLIAAIMALTIMGCENPEETAGIIYFDIPISSVNIYVTPPVRGETPNTTATGGGTGYTCGAVSWSPGDNPFLGDTAYTATVALTANGGNTFALNFAVINGEYAVIASNTQKNVTLSYTFPATSTETEPEVTEIRINTQPTLTYTHGDSLDLTGLSVTLVYNNGETENVALADFASKNIVTYPGNGTNLSYSGNENAHPVMVVYNNNWSIFVYTNNLTVNKADPTVTWPTGLTATYGQTLLNISLPGNGYGSPLGTFSWTTPNASVGSVGAQLHNMTFTPNNVNYNTLTQNVSITVNKANITAVELTITGPVNSATPTATATTTDTTYTCGAVSWNPSDNPFLGGTVYAATVTLTADSNYTFPTLFSATINGQNANISNNTGGAVTLSHTFPATNTSMATNIVIKTPPANLTYTHGDQLDLTGLAVTLTYDDAPAEDVTAAEFTAKNITVNPADGIHLDHMTHNGHPVTITYGDLPQLTTGNLIVNKAPGTFGTPTAVNATYTATLTLASLNSQLANGYAWVAPSTSLNAGNNQSFAATYTDSSGNFEAATGTITVNVAKATGAEVAAPTLNARTYNSITINTVPPPDTGQSVEYGINTSNTVPATWQSTLTFSGLIQNTVYHIFARAAGNNNYENGTASVSLTVTTPQTGTVLPDKIEYYWVNEHGSLVTTNGGTTTITAGATLAISAQGAGYVVQQWRLNGVDTGQSGNTYNFSSTTTGKHIVGLFVEKDGKLYNTNITITVTRTVTIDMYDSLSNGWGNGALRIIVNGVEIATNIKVQTGSSNTYTFSVASGDVVQLYWLAGYGQEQNAFIVYYTDAPPSPTFNGNAWNGANALVYRLYGTMNDLNNNILVGQFMVY